VLQRLIVAVSRLFIFMVVVIFGSEILPVSLVTIVEGAGPVF
jgi:hypothetical protein